jgi:hypothetical protein
MLAFARSIHHGLDQFRSRWHLLRRKYAFSRVHLPDTELDNIPSRVRLLVSKATAFQLNLAELTSSKNPADRQIINDVKLSTSDGMAATAEKVRA